MTHPIKTPLFSTDVKYALNFHDPAWGVLTLKQNLVRDHDSLPITFKTRETAEDCARVRARQFGTRPTDYEIVEMWS